MAWPEGWDRVVLDSVDSTSDEARRRAAAGAPGRLWIMARRQTAARGRRGRAWAAPEGNLSATALLRPRMPAPGAARLSFAAALAVAELVEAAAPRARVALKWPNDVLLDGGKVCGVLLESAGHGGALDWLSVGVGLNIAHHPEPEPGAWRPTSLAAAGASLTPEAALERLAERFALWAARLEAEGFAPLRVAWLARAAGLGDKVVARLPRETVEGAFVDLAEDGALVVATQAGQRRIHAADVFFA
jgi:BirA family biotin operon repressor/biotin-[acetyl-CoA-carboxylase] ligase